MDPGRLMKQDQWTLRDMQRIRLDGEAGQVSAELARRGIAANAQGHKFVEVVEDGADGLPMTAIGQAGGTFDWLADKPDLYTDADLIAPSRAG